MNTYEQRRVSVSRSSDGTRTTAVVNAKSIDRHGTLIDPAGVDIDNYKRNPVVLINHDMSLLAATATVTKQDDRIILHVDDDAWDLEDEQIARYHRKIKKGLMKTMSIGFRPDMDSLEERTTEDGQQYMYIGRSEMIEGSFVTIPSNTDAEVLERQLEKQVTGLKEEIEYIKKTGVRLLASDIERIISEVTRQINSTISTPPAHEPEVVQTKSNDEIVELAVRKLKRLQGKL